jgi:sugar phosphate isomerase/epimerase
MPHLDVKAMATDGPATELIRKHVAHGSLHANDPNRRGPIRRDGLVPIFRALKSGYAGWVSVEVFDYSRSGDDARESSTCVSEHELINSARPGAHDRKASHDEPCPTGEQP